MLELFNKSEQHTGFGILAKEAIDLMKKFGFVSQINSNAHLLEDEDDFDEEENLLIVPSLFPDDIHNQKPVSNEIDDRNVFAVYYFSQIALFLQKFTTIWLLNALTGTLRNKRI